tara:strand:- start:1554 stop:1733 length:180 start_codon:yes stop_codon:yes gene_type:complete
MLKQWISKIFKCNPMTNKYFGRKTPDIPPRRKTSLPAMERRIAASRNIIDGSLMDKDNE